MTGIEELTISEALTRGLVAFGVCAAVALVGAITLLVIAARQILEINVPEDADFFETLQVVPITVPLALDLLDFAFDIFAAPIAWFVLEMLGLQALQMVTVFEGLIPGTQLIPTLTIAWGFARVVRRRKESGGKQSALQTALQAEQQRRESFYRGNAQQLAERYRQTPLLPEDTVEAEFFEEEEELPPDYYDM